MQVGLPVVLQGLSGSYVTPPVPEPLTIASWIHFRNRGDKLGSDAHDSFKATDERRLPRDVVIDAPGDRHAATVYLADRHVVRALLGAWCRAYTATSKPPACVKVE